MISQKLGRYSHCKTYIFGHSKLILPQRLLIYLQNDDTAHVLTCKEVHKAVQHEIRLHINIYHEPIFVNYVDINKKTSELLFMELRVIFIFFFVLISIFHKVHIIFVQQNIYIYIFFFFFNSPPITAKAQTILSERYTGAAGRQS